MIHIIQMIQTWHVILLMGEILHHLWCIKHCKWWDIYHINWCRISSINSIFAVICYFNFDLALPLTLNAASNTGTRYICSIYHYALSIYIYIRRSLENYAGLSMPYIPLRTTEIDTLVKHTSNLIPLRGLENTTEPRNNFLTCAYVGISQSHTGTLVGVHPIIPWNKSPKGHQIFRGLQMTLLQVRIFKGHTNFVMCSLVIGGKKMLLVVGGGNSNIC